MTQNKSKPRNDSSGILLRLDSYDDIFSDFDPRPYEARALSRDFLMEARHASTDKDDNLTLTFLVPANKRNTTHELLIKRRLRNHFRKHVNQLQQEKRKIASHGAYFILAGVILMVLGAYVLSRSFTSRFYQSFLVVLLEPASWFFFWEGLSQIIFDSKKLNTDIEFYRKMERSMLLFASE